MSNILLSTNEGKLYTQIPNEFIDHYMPQANPVFSLIYLYALRHLSTGELTTKNIADTFTILESDVNKAFDYWQKQGLIQIASGVDSDMSITFTALKGRKSGKKIVVKPDISFGSPPKYSSVELEMYKNSYDEINNLFEYAEKSLGKLLSASDLSILYSFYDWLRLGIDVIEYMLDYCAENGHRRIKYIEAVAIDWAENNIKTVDDAKAYVNLYNKDYRDILKSLGISGRNPAPKEITFIKKWQDEYGMPIEIILEACDKTILAVGKAQFSYTDKIIASWHTAGAKTLDDIKKLEQDFKATAATTKESKLKSAPPKRTNRFVNYDQHTRDYDKIEKLESEYLLYSLKGKNNE